MKNSDFRLINTSLQNLNSVVLNSLFDTIVVIGTNCSNSNSRVLDCEEAGNAINSLLKTSEKLDIAFISKDDNFDSDVIKREIEYIYISSLHSGLTIFIPYLFPPLTNFRLDGEVKSFLISGAFKFDYFHLLSNNQEFKTIAYKISHNFLNSRASKNVNIFQIGKRRCVQNQDTLTEKESLNKSLLIIPHKGPLRLLNRCLQHVNAMNFFPFKINVCFDDLTYEKFSLNKYRNIQGKVSIYTNHPLNVGPYLCRHYSSINTACKFIFFQDSDDISVSDRFLVQIRELKERKLEMIGSHELTIDELDKCISITRFPLDVGSALSSGGFHPLFHPTTLITKKAYLKTKGFSTDLKIAYDTQFLLRAFFFLKIGNVDEFLYLRFRRKNSLTTNPRTKLGNKLRNFLLWRWVIDFRLVRENKIDINNSSLGVYYHRFNYKMKQRKKTSL